MANKLNPQSHAILQMCLDLKARGYDKYVDDLYNKLMHDRSFFNETDRIWKSHGRPDSSITYVQRTIQCGCEYLSPHATKILDILGCAAGNPGYVQVSLPDLVYVSNMTRSMVQKALKELKDCGAIRVALSASRHDAAIYEINPHIMCVGSSTNEGRKKNYTPEGVSAEMNITNREPTYCVDFLTSKKLKLKHAIIRPLPHTEDGIVKKSPETANPEPDDKEIANIKKSFPNNAMLSEAESSLFDL